MPRIYVFLETGYSSDPPVVHQTRSSLIRIVSAMSIQTRMVCCFVAAVVTATGLSAQEPSAQTPLPQAPTTQEPAQESATGTSAAPAAAGESRVLPEATPADKIPKVDRTKFDEAVKRWQKITAEYVELVLKWHLAEPSAADREQRLKWSELQGESRKAFDECVIEATKIVQVHLRSHVDVTIFLLQAVSFRAKQEWYEHTGPAIDALLSGGVETELLMSELQVDRGQLHRTAGISFYMTHEYDSATRYLEQAEKAGTLKDNEMGLGYTVTTAKASYEIEKQLLDAEAQKDDLPRVKLITSRGPVIVELFEDQAPNTTANFITLAEKGYYDNNSFYKVIAGLMAITGDPHGDGTGNAGYFIPDENTGDTARKPLRGSLVMAKLPDGSQKAGGAIANTASSQFIILQAPLAAFEKNYTIFGRVIEGMDTIAALSPVDTDAKDKKNQAAPDVILKAEVIRKRNHPYEVKKAEDPGAHAGHNHN